MRFRELLPPMWQREPMTMREALPMAHPAPADSLRPYVFLHPLGERASSGWLTAGGAPSSGLDIALVDEEPALAARLLASSLRPGGLGFAVVGTRDRRRLGAELARVGLA